MRTEKNFKGSSNESSRYSAQTLEYESMYKNAAAALIGIALCSTGSVAQVSSGGTTGGTRPVLRPQALAGENAWNLAIAHLFPVEFAAFPDNAHWFNMVLDNEPVAGTAEDPGSDGVTGTLAANIPGQLISGPTMYLEAYRTVGVDLTPSMINDGIGAMTLILGRLYRTDPGFENDIFVAACSVTYQGGAPRLVIGSCFDLSRHGIEAGEVIEEMLDASRTLPEELCEVQNATLTGCEENINTQADACLNENFGDFVIATTLCGGLATFSCSACVATPPPATVIPCAFCLGGYSCMGLAAKDALQDAFAIGIRRRAGLSCCCSYATTLDQGGTWVGGSCDFVCP